MIISSASDRERHDRTFDRAFIAVSAVLFAICATVTIGEARAMSAMRDAPLPGGWTMSMAWMRMPGQTWPQAAASFVGMWVVMMAAMMLPSVAHVLWRYSRALPSTGETRMGWLVTLAGLSYFFVWTLLGIAAYPVGAALSAVEMRQAALARSVPIAVGVVVLAAAAIQFTSFKVRHLAYCREAPGPSQTLRANNRIAVRFGWDLGVHCIYCCASFTAVLLAIGVMDLRAMALATIAMTFEAIAPEAKRAARAVGAVLAGLGLFLIAKALRLT